MAALQTTMQRLCLKAVYAKVRPVHTNFLPPSGPSVMVGLNQIGSHEKLHGNIRNFKILYTYTQCVHVHVNNLSR